MQMKMKRSVEYKQINVHSTAAGSSENLRTINAKGECRWSSCGFGNQRKLNDELKVIEKCAHGNFWLCKASGN